MMSPAPFPVVPGQIAASGVDPVGNADTVPGGLDPLHAEPELLHVDRATGGHDRNRIAGPKRRREKPIVILNLGHGTADWDAVTQVNNKYPSTTAAIKPAKSAIRHAGNVCRNFFTLTAP